MEEILKLTPQQAELIENDFSEKIFLAGKSGTGKTSAAKTRVKQMLDRNEAGSTLVFAPTFKHRMPYMDIISDRGRTPEVTSYNAFVRKSIALFWPLFATAAGFNINGKPHFLDIDTEQIIISRFVEKRINEGKLSALSGTLSRICNQIVIAMHKCAAAMLPFGEYSERMKASWQGDKSFRTVFDAVQECGFEFTDYCRKNNLLDYSLQLEVFNTYILPNKIFRKWVSDQRFDFVFENVEEEVPAAHHFVREMADSFRSLLLICDSDAGYRSFMGGDPESAASLPGICNRNFVFSRSFTQSCDMEALENVIKNPKLTNEELGGNPRKAFAVVPDRQFAKMIKSAVSDVSELINNKGVDPQRIVILSPLVSDLLYTEMERGLKENGIMTWLNRPSRPLINEKVTRSLIMLASLVVPEFGIEVKPLDIVQMLLAFVSDVDPLRTQLYVGGAYKHEINDKGRTLYRIKAFNDLPESLKQRIPEEMGHRFEKVRTWIENEKKKPGITPDKTVYDFFCDILNAEGFACNEETVLSVCKILESMRRFSELLNAISSNGGADDNMPSWADFFRSVSFGAVKASFHEEIYTQPVDAVLISLTSSYLSADRHDDYQIWLNIASPRWRDRINGELTNDIVLSRNRQPGAVWDARTIEYYNDVHMNHQVSGLLRRCRKGVLAYSCDMDESGRAMRGKLLKVFSTIAHRFPR